MLGMAPWVFWMTAAGLSLAVMAIMGVALRRAAAASGTAAEYDLRVYRDQLAEVERDLARGVIAPEDAARMRTEISRRVLEADRAMREGTTISTAAPGPMVLGVVTLALIAAAFGLYWKIGAPGYPDMPLTTRLAVAEELRATRPDQARAEAEATATRPAAPAIEPKYAELVEKLRTAVAANPNDLQGQELLARNEAALGNFAAAYAAQRQVIALKSPKARGEDHAILAELMILAADGYVSPEAEAALAEALKADPANGTARYYSGMMLAQTGRPDLAFRMWKALLEDSAPGDPWLAPLRDQIGMMAARAGVDYQVPDFVPPTDLDAPGPTAADMEAAAAMSPEDRQAMIRGMVDQLNDRLATEGGSAEEWARLIGALGQLGETDRARTIWTEAQGRFAERPEDLDLLRAAAVQAGVAK
jgi:cytochrome c-type biogenesis protein CcmH